MHYCLLCVAQQIYNEHKTACVYRNLPLYYIMSFPVVVCYNLLASKRVRTVRWVAHGAAAWAMAYTMIAFCRGSPLLIGY